MEAPLDRSSNWPYEDGEPGRFSYARADHPTGVACENALGGLDGGQALLFPSGMAAVTCVVLTMLPPGGTIALAEGAYYGPCDTCRADLRTRYAGTSRVVEVAEYEPKMNVTPNAVALKDD